MIKWKVFLNWKFLIVISICFIPMLLIFILGFTSAILEILADKICALGRIIEENKTLKKLVKWSQND